MSWKRTWAIVLLLGWSVVAVGQQQAQEKPSPKPDTTTFSVGDANDVLAQVREGLEGHSQRKFFAAFDGSKMVAYASFQEQIQAFFSRNDGIRINIRSIQTSTNGERGIITAGFEMETVPRSGSAVRHEAQVRIELERSGKSWRIVDISPRDFFS